MTPHVPPADAAVGNREAGAGRRQLARDGSGEASPLPRAVPSLILAAVVLVPWIFSIRLYETFSIPKLVALWLVLLGAVGVVLGTAWRRALYVERAGIPERALVLFLLLNCLAFAFSIDHGQSLMGERLQYQGLLTVLLYAGFFWLGKRAFNEERRFHLLLGAVMAGATGVATYALVQEARLDPIWGGYLPYGRVFSSIGQPTALAAYFVLTIPVSLSLLRRVGLWARLAVGLAAAAMVMSILFSESRGAGLGLLVALAILGAGALPKGIWNWRRRRLRRAIYIVVTVVMVSLILAIFVPTVRSAAGDLWRGANALGDVFQDRSARRHLDMWLVGINIAADHPLLGAGQDTYPLLFPEYADQVLPPDRARAYAPYRVESPHNVYLAIAVGAGLPALAAYLAFVAAVILSIVRVARRTEDRHARLVLFGVVAALSGHLVTDLFMTADLTGSWLFWLLMGVGLGFARLVSRHGAAGSSRPTAGSMVAGGSPGTPRAGV